MCNQYSDQSIEIKLVDQQGRNLLFGANAIYSKDSMKVLAQRNSFDIHNASVSRGLKDTGNIQFHFYIPAGKSFIHYDQQSQYDSLEIKWIVKTATCQNGGSLKYNGADSVKFNGRLVKPINGTYIFTK